MGEVSEWLEEALTMAEQRRKEVRGFRVIVECEPKRTKEAMTEFRRRNLKIIGHIRNFVFVDVEEAGQLDEIARVPGVVYVSKEKIFWPMAYGIDELFKRMGISADPLLSKLSGSQLEKLGFSFKPAAEIPTPIKAMVENIQSMMEVATNPSKAIERIKLVHPLALPVITRADWKLVTDTRELLGVPKDNRLTAKTYTAVIDSGVRYGPGLGTPAEIESIPLTLYPELPVDHMSHGSWCHACAFGKPAITRYGDFYPVANAPKSLHVKVFTGVGGCTSEQVMKAMEIASAQHKANVISMSLGGTQGDPVDKDPECKLLDQLTKENGTIFVVAAGNEDGKFEIGTPGAALKALTVAALDWKKKYNTSSYSSRGWQGKFYEKHPDTFREHHAKWGDEFLKPDCGGIGGDRDSQIVSACSFWYDGVYDFVPDGWDLMIGTSMATPHIAGLVALAIDRGLLPQNVDKIKEVLRRTASEEYIFGGEMMDGKSHEQGWGVFHWERLLKKS